MFKRVSTPQRRIRLALDGPSGSGKTYTALRFAFAIAGPNGRVAVIDTEAGSASLYTSQAPDGFPWAWDGVSLEYHAPSTYQTAIEEAGRQGYDVLVIDSLSHAWTGVGGALAQVDAAAAKTPGGNFGAWREVTPAHESMVRSMMTSPCHVIVTLRTKMEYALEEDERGKKTVKKLGTKPIQREGVEYEFDIVADLDLQHRLTVSKTRYVALDGKVVMRPGPEFIQPVIDWLSRGAPAPTASVVAVPAPDHGPGTPASPLSSPVAAAPGITLSAEEPKCDHVTAAGILETVTALGWPPEKLPGVLAAQGYRLLEEVPLSKAQELDGLLRAKLLEQEAEAAF